MSRLIDADAVLKSMEIVSDKCKTLDETIIAVNMISIVENAPEVDAEPVRYGRWIKSGIISGKCSECGEISVDIGKYCSNCGAKMEDQ